MAQTDGIDQYLRLLRWRLRRVYASLRYGRSALENTPILFGNSFPKSGTHLLSQVLLAFPRIGLAVDRGMGPILTYVRFTGHKRLPAEILKDVEGLKPGDISFGHIIAAPEIIEYWNQQNIAHYFMYRDPRDVVVSHAFYIGDKATQNVHHQYYKDLPLDERVRVSILGRPDWEGDFPDISSRYELYLDWLDCAGVCVLRFEDFVASRQAILEKILGHAIVHGFRLHLNRQRAMDTLSEAINPQRSFTFRSGRVGDWQQHFTEEHKQLFKDVSGNLLIRLGYERDNDW